MCFSLYEATIKMHELRAQRHVIEARDPGPARSQGIHVTGVWVMLRYGSVSSKAAA